MSQECRVLGFGIGFRVLGLRVKDLRFFRVYGSEIWVFELWGLEATSVMNVFLLSPDQGVYLYFSVESSLDLDLTSYWGFLDMVCYNSESAALRI